MNLVQGLENDYVALNHPPRSVGIGKTSRQNFGENVTSIRSCQSSTIRNSERFRIDSMER